MEDEAELSKRNATVVVKEAYLKCLLQALYAFPTPYKQISTDPSQDSWSRGQEEAERTGKDFLRQNVLAMMELSRDFSYSCIVAGKEKGFTWSETVSQSIGIATVELKIIRRKHQ